MKVGTDGVLLGAWAFRSVAPFMKGRALDVGCGSGVISLMLAQRFSSLEITGVDIMSEAIWESCLNFENSMWGERLKAVQTDFVQLECDFKNNLFNPFDLIISNPPFFRNGEFSPDIARKTARHEGNLNYMSLISIGAKILSTGGRLALISTADAKDKIISEGIVNYLYPERVCSVFTTGMKVPKRVMIEFVKDKKDAKMINENLIIHSPEGGYTDKYIELVSDFYIHL